MNNIGKPLIKALKECSDLELTERASKLIIALLKRYGKAKRNKSLKQVEEFHLAAQWLKDYEASRGIE